MYASVQVHNQSDMYNQNKVYNHRYMHMFILMYIYISNYNIPIRLFNFCRVTSYSIIFLASLLGSFLITIAKKLQRPKPLRLLWSGSDKAKSALQAPPDAPMKSLSFSRPLNSLNCKSQQPTVASCNTYNGLELSCSYVH